MNNKIELKRLYYIATPFRSSDRFEMMKRVSIATEVTTFLTSRGICVYSPIHVNGLWQRDRYSQYNLPSGWEFWETIDKSFLIKSDGLIVILMEGWEKSQGVRSEIEFARLNNIQTYYIPLNDLFVKINNEESLKDFKHLPQNGDLPNELDLF